MSDSVTIPCSQCKGNTNHSNTATSLTVFLLLLLLLMLLLLLLLLLLSQSLPCNSLKMYMMFPREGGERLTRSKCFDYVYLWPRQTKLIVPRVGMMMMMTTMMMMMTMMMMTMMMAIFIERDSINLNAQCSEGGERWEVGIESHEKKNSVREDAYRIGIYTGAS